MTGQDFDRLFDQRRDKAYTGYLDNEKRKRLYKIGLYEAIEQKYQSGDKQKIYDELFGLIKTNKQVVPVNNQVLVNNIVISNIITSPTYITVFTKGKHGLVTGDSITIKEAIGTGTFSSDVNDNTQIVTVLSTTEFTMPIITSGTYISGGYLVYNKDGILSNYLHLLAIRTRFDKEVGLISSATASTPCKININAPMLRSKMKVKIDGATGMTDLNGEFYISKIGINKFALFLNKNLDNPLITTGSYDADTATLSVINEYWAKPLFSDRKFSPYTNATINTPYYEFAENRFKIYPDDEKCNYLYFDFISAPTFFIDPENTTVYLTDIYNEKFLYYVLDTVIKLFAGTTRDQILYQLQTKEIIDNP